MLYQTLDVQKIIAQIRQQNDILHHFTQRAALIKFFTYKFSRVVQLHIFQRPQFI